MAVAKEWWTEGWGILPAPVGNGKWLVVYGDSDMAATSGIYRNRRRAKKEITHYIERGAARGPHHGIYRRFDKACGRFLIARNIKVLV